MWIKLDHRTLISHEAVDIDNEGDTPHTPPENTDTIVEPGGSPSDEVMDLYDPAVSSLTPNTAAVGADATVTVAGSNYAPDAVVEADGTEMDTVNDSGTSLTATLTDPGAAGVVGVTVRNPSTGFESNTVDFTWTAAEEDS